MRDDLLEQLLEQQIITNNLLQKQLTLLAELKTGSGAAPLEIYEDTASIRFSDLWQIRIDYFYNSKTQKVDVEYDDGFNKGVASDDRIVRNPKYSVSFFSGMQRTTIKKGKQVRNGVTPKLMKKSVGIFTEDLSSVPQDIITVCSELGCDINYYFKFHDRLSPHENNAIYLFERRGSEFLLFLMEDETLYVAGREMSASKGSEGYYAYLRPADFVNYHNHL